MNCVDCKLSGEQPDSSILTLHPTQCTAVVIQPRSLSVQDREVKLVVEGQINYRCISCYEWNSHWRLQATSSRQLAQNNDRLVSRSLSWWMACPVVGLQTSEVSVQWLQPWCDDWGMSVLWCCCDSWRSTQPPCTWFYVEWATNAAHAVMAGHDIVLQPGEQSWLHCFACAAEPECCWLEHCTALTCSSPVWSVWDCKPVSLRLL